MKNKSPLNLYYEIHGKGKPILFLHGFGASMYVWRHLIKPLSKKYKLILVDLKGHGASPKPRDKKYSVYDQADLIYNLIIKHNLKNLTIVGHSFGGGVALIIALYLTKRLPERLAKLILIDSAGYKQRHPLFIKLLEVPVIGRLVFSLPDKSLTRSTLKMSFYDKNKILDNVVDSYAKLLTKSSARHALVQTARQLVNLDLKKIICDYPKIKVPTLIIWGKEDTVIPLEIGKKLYQAIPSSELKIIDNCGHIPQEEKPNKTLEIIERFLKT